ncbi:hypothetical protein Plec18167_008000 [Paecilomyces lecythidis]|uniref:FAD dependent oxidoreductase domain-containing protein n=1 Tax=Paecilomyces lecythidis TaxID=3004212 RepID=A0ABR3WZ81_9EURO
MSQQEPLSTVILGGGVTGLTVASELLRLYPHAKITIVAKHLPGDVSFTEYASPQAGANWASFEEELGRYATYDRVAFERFLRIAEEFPESGVKRFPMRFVFDDEKEKVKRLWYADLVGGVKDVDVDEGEKLPEGAKSAVDLTTFMINPVAYLIWLQTRLLKNGVQFIKRAYNHIDQVFEDFSDAAAVFNCTALGARNLGGVEDKNVYPAKGQTLLIAEPKTPIRKMYIWDSSKFGNNEFSHVFPRPLGGGIIIGGVKIDNDWDDKPDMARAERIKERACQLCPELGRPDQLQVISHNVGLRPARKGGARVEAETRKGKILVHNYGAGGAGYQSSWGTAAHAVELFSQQYSARQSKL